MNKINLNKDNNNTSNNIFNTNNMPMMGMGGMGMPMMGGMGPMRPMQPMGQMQNPKQPKSRHIILKIALLIWSICTIRAVLSVISEGIEMKNSIEVTALVIDCLAKEVYDDDDYSHIEYVTYVRYTTDRTYEGRTTLSQRYKEGDYITINVSSKDNSKIVGNTGSVGGNIFMVLFISSIFLICIIVVRNVLSE